MRVLTLLLLLTSLPLSAAAQTESLAIGPADLLHIKVLEAPELEQIARVTDAGTVPLILNMSVPVAGLTPFQAAHAIEQAMIAGNYLLTPHVSVSIDTPATQSVTVSGQVRAPGTYPTGTPRSILDVVALAGGLTELADRRVTIERRRTKEHFDVYLANNANAALQNNLLVYPGDLVIVPKAEVVYLLGDFNRPGGFAMVTNDSRLSLLQAVTLASGTPASAVPSHARLLRKQPDGTYAESPLQLTAIIKGKQPDIALKADDIVYVPFSYVRNTFVSAGGVIASTSSAAIYHF